MTRDFDTSAHPAAQPCAGWPQGGPRFRRGTVVATHNTITDHTPKVKFQVAQIGLYEQTLCKGGITSKGSHKVRTQQGGDQKIKTQRKRT